MESKTPAKLDLKKQLKHLYLPSAREVTVVDVPEMKFIVVDGQIEPNATPGTSLRPSALFMGLPTPSSSCPSNDRWTRSTTP